MKALLLIPLILFTTACQAQTDLDRRVISTNGYGEIKTAPDRAIVSFTARATHRTGKTAKEAVDNQVNGFLGSLKQLNIPQQDIVASQLRIQPRYEYRSNSGRFFAGYEASRSIRVTLHQLDELTAVMDTGLSAGIDSIDGVSYESSREEVHREQAHQQAIEDSKAKAVALAKAYDAELGPIVRIDYHSDQVRYKGVRADALEAASFRANATQPGVYLPDQLTFSDRIQVIFDLIVDE